MAINFLGVGSGLQLQTMLDQLVEVATTPKIEQLGKKEAQVNSSISGLGSIKSSLSDFQDSIEKLNSTSLYGNNTASIAQPESGEILSVSADSTAASASYEVSVTSLAKGAMFVSDSDLSAYSASGLSGGSSNLSFDAGAGNSFTVAIDDGDDLAAIAAKINDADDNFGVSATIVDGSLVYKSSVTGSANNLAVSNDDSGLDSLSTVPTVGPAGFTGSRGLDANAQDASIKVDGITVTSETNSFENVVSGLTFTASKVSEAGEVATVTVGKDTGSITSAVNDMVESYNEVMAELKKQHGTTDEDGNFTPGPMFGESIVRQMESFLSSSMSSVVSTGNSALNSMASLGLDLQSDGSISIDSDKLSDAITNNFEDLSTLFTGSSGFAGQLESTLESYLDYDGIIDGTESSYKQELDSIEEQYEDHIAYVTSYKETLTKQFSSLDSTIASLNATRDYMMSQLSQLPSISG